MQKLRSYISILMLMLLLFPMLERAMHEFEHLSEKHCGIKETHFCEVEHSCTICDYTFSSSATAPKEQNQLAVVFVLVEQSVLAFVTNAIISFPYTFSLRGPPVC